MLLLWVSGPLARRRVLRGTWRRRDVHRHLPGGRVQLRLWQLQRDIVLLLLLLLLLLQ